MVRLSAFSVLLLLAVVIGCAGPPASELDLAAEVERVRAANQAWFEAESRRDLEGIMPHVALNAVFQPADAPSFSGHEAARAFFAEFFELPYASFGGGPDTILVASSGDLAIDIGHSRMVMDGPERTVEVEGKYLAAWQKIEGEWKCVAISWSANAPSG